MKKNLLFLYVALVAFCASALCNTVSVQSAQTIAVNFYKVNNPAAANSNVTATLNYTQTEADNTIDFYVFNISPLQGFVIVSGDDNTIPVLGYSNEAHFNANAPHNGVSDWLKHTALEVRQTVQHHIIADARIRNLWSAYTLGQNPNVSRAAAIGPLLTTTWNQEPYYNILCPFNSTDNQRTLTGCVATTMAQIMKYWNYPARGTGSYTYNDAPTQFTGNYGTQAANFNFAYNWSGMPNNVTSNTNPCDTLMYHCGVSVAMNYGDDNEDGSGAYVLQSEAGNGKPCSQQAYVNYFYYNPNTIQGVKLSAYSSAAWIALMENELNSGRVIQYEGDDANAGGHTWVCDGYDVNDMLHMNWGWGGQSNGFFTITSLNAGGYNFNQNDAALIGIEPLKPFNVSITSSGATICPGSSTTLTVNGPAIATYTWTPATGLDCTTCGSVTATPTSSTLYTVTADSAGVISKASMAVVITQPVTANFTQALTPSCHLPESVSFTSTATHASSYFWDFGDGTTSTSQSGIHAYQQPGNYVVSLIGTNNCGTDTMTKTQAVHINSGPPVSSIKNICAGETASLYATAAGGITWYDAADPIASNELGTGNSFTTPTLNATTTYYAEAFISTPVVALGLLNNATATGTYYTHTTKRGMVFNCTTEQTLVSVDVYTDSAGARLFMLQDSSGNIIDSATVNVLTGHRTVTLNFDVPVGNKLMLVTSGFCYMYRSTTGITYPYTLPDGSVSITGNTSNSAGSYYYFYNWKLQQQSCVTSRTPVTVYVLGNGGGSFTATSNGNAVNFMPADTIATIYSWNFGDGSTSNQLNPAHTYTTAGTYTVQLVVSNGTCSETTTQTVSTLTATGINEAKSGLGLDVFPNPTNDQLHVTINTGNSESNSTLKITNILGASMIVEQVQLNTGANTLSMDVSELAAGVYFLTVQNGKMNATKRFVKAN